MKHFKKLVSLLLATIMVFGLTATALATEGGGDNPGGGTEPVVTPPPTYNSNMQGGGEGLENGKITINNAVAGQKYDIYQILYLESYNATPGHEAYSYKANDDWAGFISTVETDGDTPQKYFSTDGQGYVTWNAPTGMDENVAAADVAKKALKYAKDNSIQPINQAPVVATTTTVVFPNLFLGYYLVDSTLGTLCSLDTTNPEVTMLEKNAKPTNEKNVEEDSTHEYGKVNDAEVGEIVNFRSTVTLPKGSEKVTYHDTMSAGLTLKTDSIKVYTDAAMTPGTELAVENYDVNTNPQESHGEGANAKPCTFTVSFKQEYLDLHIGTGAGTRTEKVYIKYSAEINANAIIDGDGNVNSSHLSYGNDGTTETTPSTTKTYVWSFDVHKIDGQTGNALENAEFVLLSSDRSMIAKFANREVVIGSGDAAVTVIYRQITAWDTFTVGYEFTDDNKLISANDGFVHVAGLDSGNYYLREIKAPAGYNILDSDKEVPIESATEGSGEETTMHLTSDMDIIVKNNTGAEMPETGGIGTTIFYVVGSILLVGAVVLLITKKRMSVSK